MQSDRFARLEGHKQQHVQDFIGLWCRLQNDGSLAVIGLLYAVHVDSYKRMKLHPSFEQHKAAVKVLIAFANYQWTRAT